MKIALIGYGKMGKTIENLAIQRGHQVVLKVNSKNISALESFDFLETDVALEFTNPGAALSSIQALLDRNVSIVSGTTGWLQHKADIESQVLNKNASSFLHATNFSLGVNLFFELNRKLATLISTFDGYEAAIEETHHTEKLDAPSGTAITLAEDLLNQHPRYQSWALKDEQVQSNKVLNITALRQNDVPGEHKISYSSSEDEISIKHTAYSRDGFALGALLAAEFICNKKGVFTMQDVLGIT